MRYKCIQAFRDITVGDIVSVHKSYSTLGTAVYITKDKRTNITNEFILNIHFEKVEQTI